MSEKMEKGGSSFTTKGARYIIQLVANADQGWPAIAMG